MNYDLWVCQWYELKINLSADLYTTIRCRVGAKGTHALTWALETLDHFCASMLGYTLQQVDKLKQIAAYNQGTPSL